MYILSVCFCLLCKFASLTELVCKEFFSLHFFAMECSLEEYIASNEELQDAINIYKAARGKLNKKNEVQNDEDEIEESDDIWRGPSSKQAYLSLNAENNDDEEVQELRAKINNMQIRNPLGSTEVEGLATKSFSDLRERIDWKRNYTELPAANSQQWRLRSPNLVGKRPPGMPVLIPNVCIANVSSGQNFNRRSNNQRRRSTFKPYFNKTNHRMSKKSNFHNLSGNCCFNMNSALNGHTYCLGGALTAFNCSCGNIHAFNNITQPVNNTHFNGLGYLPINAAVPLINSFHCNTNGAGQSNIVTNKGSNETFSANTVSSNGINIDIQNKKSNLMTPDFTPTLKATVNNVGNNENSTLNNSDSQNNVDINSVLELLPNNLNNKTFPELFSLLHNFIKNGLTVQVLPASMENTEEI